MSNRIADLNPLFQPVAATILSEVGDMIAPSIIKPSVTFRTIKEQRDAKAAGATTVNIGYHNFGLAMDVVVLTPGGVYIKNGEDWRYRVFGIVAKRHGCAWGGDWHNKDYDHIEYAAGLKNSEYMAWLTAHILA